MQNLINKILKDISVDLLDEFDRNFERKAFFNKPWPQRKQGRKGSLMLVKGGGGLRGSIKASVGESTVSFTSSLPYAAIHNEGGTITVTPKMKRFFWSRYYELTGKVKHTKSGKVSKRSVSISDEAEFYKNLALMKAGSKITIPQRQFIGHAPEVDMAVKRIVDNNFKELDNYLKNLLKPNS